MTLRLTLIAVIAALSLAGCGNTPTKEATPAFKAPLTAFDYYELAAEQYRRADETNQVGPLLISEKLFEKSLSMQPDNVNIQQAYYETLAWASLVKKDYSEKSVQEKYNALHPVIQKEMVPPAKITYFRLADTANAQELLPILKRAVQQKPYDAHTWKALSETYAELDNNWMAIASAEQALQYKPDEGEYLGRLAYALNGLIEERSCHFEEKELIKRSAFYGTRAATLTKKNDLYSGLVGLQYMRLGLHPLAHQFAKRSYESAPDAWSGSLLIDSYINLGKYDDAAQIAQSLLDQKADYQAAYRDLALQQASLGQWAQASALYNQFTRQTQTNLYNLLIGGWLEALATGKPLAIDLSQVQPNGDWETRIYEHLTTETGEPHYLTAHAKDICERADAHFYTAMHYWQNNQKQKAKEHLNLSRKQGATWFQEHFWADVLLKTL